MKSGKSGIIVPCSDSVYYTYPDSVVGHVSIFSILKNTGKIMWKYAMIINPRHACAMRVTVLGLVCVCMCLSVISDLACHTIMCPTIFSLQMVRVLHLPQLS